MTSDWVKPGAVVIDVGINVRGPQVPTPSDDNQKPLQKVPKLVGDVAFKEVSKVRHAVTGAGRWVCRALAPGPTSGLSSCGCVCVKASHDQTDC